MHNSAEHTHTFWQNLKSKKLFLACSGGIDSMVLLHLFKSLDIHFTVLHVNYQLRGEASNEDAEFVRGICEEQEIPFELLTVDLKQALENGGNLQDEARKVRYDWFREVLERDQNNRVALAHHSDDQIETFWMNLSRKSGVLGMSCMKAEHEGIVRPLLHFSRLEIMKYAQVHSVQWREDQSNYSNAYTRNRLRHEFIPFLSKEIPNLKQSVLELILHFQHTQLELEKKIAPLVRSILKTSALSIEQFDGLSASERVELLRQLGIPASFSVRIEALIERGKQLKFNTSIFEKLVRDEHQYTFIRKEKRTFKLIVEDVVELPNRFSKDIVYFDAAKLNGQLRMRTWEIGDRISPIGMKGSQLISDVIKDAKITADAKQHQLVVHDDSEILWCVGLKISKKALPDSQTERVLRCSVSDSTTEE